MISAMRRGFTEPADFSRETRSAVGVGGAAGCSAILGAQQQRQNHRSRHLSPFTLPSAVQQTGFQSDRAAHESCVGSTAAAGSAPHTHDFAARSPARGPRLLVPEHRRMSTPARVGWSAPSNPDAGVDRRDVYRGLPPNVNATHSASKAEEPSLRTLPEAPDRRCDAEC